MSKNKTYDLEGDASFKQNWRIAHNFAKHCESMFPDYEYKEIANRFRGAIFYYHERMGTKLSKKDASDFITNDPPVPQYYLDEFKDFLKKNKKSNKQNNSDKPTLSSEDIDAALNEELMDNDQENEEPTNSSNSLLDLMEEDINSNI